ncbi:glycosyltransferase family 2 protein [Candidatus Nitrotoga arctica]|uniref:Glyco_trans_2-like domain-containing protein n=1 Tax=Candidatus Nitrotoga arctica TaxID=453162 RepID=A0ABM8YZ10_9PROT|nr:glycosyltransferase [Candidatus Nitrotoga arctica]CAG9932790.1 Glyco_trans_2-like domain-containing protein [Candidatus Nitrotoga arctica]
MKPSISICIPTYNGEKYLAQCLDSVRAQTYSDFEVLVVDDCSSDTTFEIASEYATRDSRIRVLRNERNLGLVHNWNHCIELTQGEWIKFVFQDDLIAPTCLERMLHAVQPDSVLVFCRREFIFEEGTTQSILDYYLAEKALVERLFPNSTPVTARQFSELVLNNLGRNLIGEPSVVMLHKRVFQEFGNFNSHLIVSCDLEYWVRVGIHAGVVPVPEYLASFRVHGASVSARSLLQRNYRMNVLDGLVLFHEAVFNSRYAPLREVAAYLSVNLAQQFRSKALWAYGLAKRAARNGTNPDGSLLNEWQDVAIHFKGLSSVPLRYSLLRQWHLIVWHCRTLLGLDGTEK